MILLGHGYMILAVLEIRKGQNGVDPEQILDYLDQALSHSKCSPYLSIRIQLLQAKVLECASQQGRQALIVYKKVLFKVTLLTSLVPDSAGILASIRKDVTDSISRCQM
jgi:hypothetical protein